MALAVYVRASMAPAGVSSRRQLTRASAAPPAGQGRPAQKSRRAALGLTSGAALAAFFAASVQPAQAGQFKGKMTWDGQAGMGMCELGDEGAECRAKDFEKDAGKLASDVMSKADRQGALKTGQAEKKVDYAVYSSESSDLISEIDSYLELDVFDKQRRVATGEIQTNSKVWTSKYAPGGSARLESAQKLYVVVDSLLGHFASNGLAPLPDTMKAKARSDMATARTFLDKGK